MSPLQIDMLMHWHCRATDPEMIGQSKREAVKYFLANELIQPHEPTAIVSAEYRLTDRGAAYVHALQMVPLPAKKWVMEWPEVDLS